MRYGKEVKLEAEELLTAMFRAKELCISMNTLKDKQNIYEMIRLAREHNKLAEKECNRELKPSEVKRQENIQARIKELATNIGLKVHFDGDPRGFTVKLHAPNQDMYNTWGGAETGYGIGENA